MKYLITMFALLALISCGAKTPEKNIENNSTESSTSALNSELNKELESLTGSSDETKVTKLDMSYKNPKGENIEISVDYTLDKEGKISEINFDGYSHNGFAEKAKAELVGKSLEEAKDLYVSGASLASEAFRKAIKNA